MNKIYITFVLLGNGIITFNLPDLSANGAGSRTWTNISCNITEITINSTGGGFAFSVMNPFLALNYIIKY